MGSELPLYLEDCYGCKDILAELQARREKAQQQAIEAKQRDVAKTPIDDQAWRAELQRRAEVERR